MKKLGLREIKQVSNITQPTSGWDSILGLSDPESLLCSHDVLSLDF